MSDALTAADFDAFFEGNTVTLMSARSLRRELALLRAALPPATAADAPKHPLFQEDVAWLVAILTERLPAAPETVDAMRHRLAPLKPSESRQLRQAAIDARLTLRRCRHPPGLFLVPAQFSLRVAQMLEGQFLPVTIRHWAVRYQPRPPSLPWTAPAR